MVAESVRSRKIAVLGGGPMGLIVTSLLVRNGHPVRLWLSDRRQAEKLRRTRSANLMGRPYPLADEVEISSDYSGFESGSWIVFAVMPSRALEDSLERLLSHLALDERQDLILFTKGLVSAAVRKKRGVITFSDYIDVLGRERGFTRLEAAAINGPSLLQEMHEREYSFLNVGCASRSQAILVRDLLENEWVHVRGSRDRTGVELGGVLKNPIAIAAGIAAGLPQCGSNFLGELMSVGFREMMRLGQALGANPATLIGRSGLADLITTGISPHSRNRAYGRRFVEELFSGDDDLGIKDRIQLFVNPAAVIEKEVLKSRNLVEGAFAIAAILDLAKEKGVELPLYSTLFGILSRRIPPQELISLLGKSPPDLEEMRNMPAKEKVVGLGSVRGHDFRAMLEQRIQRRIIGTPGMQSRVKRQAHQVIQSLERRLARARKTKNKRELAELPHECELWQNFENADHDQEAATLEAIIAYYVSEIADNFRAGMRHALIRALIPARYVAGGVRPGAALPYLGGNIEEVKHLAERYNILYAPTHRSHLDSVEVAFGLQWLNLPIPRYAAGINLMSGPFWSWILKSLGAYAVDREKTRNILYLESLTAYSVLMLESGIPSLVYPEGTRSRTGGIEPLKTGLLSTAIDAYRYSGREVIVVPIALSYESTPEDRMFAGEERDPGFTDFITGRSKVYMDLGQPVRISQHINDKDPALAVGHAISDAWFESQRVLPNQIVAQVLIENDLKITLKELPAIIADFIGRVPGNYLTINPAAIIDRGVRILRKRGFVEVKAKIVRGRKEEALRYYGSMALRRL